jgi:predicted secreted Zn-dependent protease
MYDRQGISCGLKDVRVTLQVRVELPRWDGSAAADSSSIQWWETFRTRLVDHEREHVKIAVEESGSIVTALRRLSGGSCDALGLQANNTAQALLARIQAKQDAFDRDTRHGTLPRRP